MIIPMLCVTIFVILVVWFLLPRVARTIRPIDRKSGSAGMPRPRSTLFPYTTLFRSDRLEAFYDNPNALRDYFRDIGRMVLAAEGRKDHTTNRSEERFSRNAETEIYTLSLHDALPI